MLALIEVDRVFVLWASQIKDYKISLVCFSVKHALLKIKGKDSLTGNMDVQVQRHVYMWTASTI